MTGDASPPSEGLPASEDWQAADVHRLRSHLGETQTEFAYRLGTRQQTVSEWETGSSRPRRMARRLLRLVAEERGFYVTGEAANERLADPLPGESGSSHEPPSGTDHERDSQGDDPEAQGAAGG